MYNLNLHKQSQILIKPKLNFKLFNQLTYDFFSCVMESFCILQFIQFSIQYSVQCTMNSVQFTSNSVQFTSNSVQRTMNSAQFTSNSVQRTINSAQCRKKQVLYTCCFTVYRTACNTCTLRILHCTIFQIYFIIISWLVCDPKFPLFDFTNNDVKKPLL